MVKKAENGNLFHIKWFYKQGLTIIVIFMFFIQIPNLTIAEMEPNSMNNTTSKLSPGQIKRVDWMPNFPSPYEMRDWNKVTKDYDSFIFDFDKIGDYLPFIHWSTEFQNFPRNTFNLPSYVGSVVADEAINCLAAVLGATLVGIDKSNQNGVDWVLMCENWYNIDTAQHLYLNNRRTMTGKTFWYELLPTVLFYQLAYYYPTTGDFQNETYQIAERWYEACVALGGSTNPWQNPNFNYTAFDFLRMSGVDNGQWREPDAAAAVGWLEYISWLKWGDERFLTAADWCISFLDQLTFNPLYEILLPYGAYTAARMNAELGRNYDVNKIINWCFDPSYVRPGWGVITGRWGQYDCNGLHGSMTDGGGYAFAMGTFQNVGALIPLTRYDDRYSRAIGKYVLNAANAARLYYGNGLPYLHQDSEDWLKIYDPDSCIAYEGLRKDWNGIAPLATGDVNQDRYLNQQGPTNLGLYGSSHVGIFGGIISPTNIEGILQLDCLKTDYYHDDAYPTFLYYNPYNSNKTVEINVGQYICDLYDATTNSFLKKGVSGLSSFILPSNTAALIVIVPSEGTLSYIDNKTLINGVIVDYTPEIFQYSKSTSAFWFTPTLALIVPSLIRKLFKQTNIKKKPIENYNKIEGD
ncbi:hypothetical protein [Candidatus Hodarchaeum mangrovi]